MTAKEELKQYKYARRRVEETLEEYERYKTRAEKMTTIISGMPVAHGGSSDKVGDNASVMADIENEYILRWISAEQLKLTIEDKIDEVEEPYRTILHMKYIREMSLGDIADDLKYKSYTYLCEEHGIALKKYEENRTNPKTTEV